MKVVLKQQYHIPKQQTTTDNRKKRNGARNIIWFNPPYSQNVKTNIRKTFLKLVKNHFPRDNKLCKYIQQKYSEIKLQLHEKYV